MFYDFPADITLEEVREVVREHNVKLGATSFIEANRGDHVIFNYVVAFTDSFPQPDPSDPVLARKHAILRECRGLVFDANTGLILSRRYHKFFNVNEKAFTQAALIDWKQPHVILEKLDGSMIAPYPHAGRPDGISWGTKMGATDVSFPVEQYVAENPQYRDLFHALHGNGFSPIFEWCSRKQKIVVDYKEDRLVLTAVRNNKTGAYEPHKALVVLGKEFNVPVVGALPGSAENIEQFMAEAYDMEGAEGYVIRFDNGHMLKIKGRWYCEIHRTKDNLTREKDVWQMLLNNTVDDVLPFMDADDRDRVERFQAEFERRIAEAAWMYGLAVYAGQAVGQSKKDFVSWVIEKYPNRAEHGLLFAIWDGRDPIDVIKQFLIKNYNTGTKVDNVRWIIGGLKWDDYRDQSVVLDA